MNRRRTIVVTGASGFVGGDLVAKLRAEGHQVRALVRDRAKAPEVDELVVADLGSGEPLDSGFLAGCDAVVHLAARIPARQNDPAEAEACWRVNALGTLRLLEAAIDTGVGHFVHALSANAYRLDIACASEDAPMYPGTRATYYLTSKIAQELYAGFRAAGTGTAVTALRLASVYGPGQPGGMLPALISRLRSGQSVSLVNGGRFGADFVFVSDVSAAVTIALEHRAEGAFNVGSGRRVTVREVVDLLLRESGADPSLVVPVSAENDDAGFPALDVTKLRALGYDPLPFEAGLRQTLAAG